MIEHLVVATVFSASYLVLPVCIAVAILRHRLFDIDRLITGTLVYGVLWLAITLAYLGLTTAFDIAIGSQLPGQLAVGFAVGIALVVI